MCPQSQRFVVSGGTKLHAYPEEAMDLGHGPVGINEIINESPSCPPGHLSHVAYKNTNWESGNSIQCQAISQTILACPYRAGRGAGKVGERSRSDVVAEQAPGEVCKHCGRDEEEEVGVLKHGCVG